jgi:hypothetical protein
MASVPSSESPGHRSDGVWGMGHLDGGVRKVAQHGSYSRRVRMHGAISPGSNNLHPLRAWIILGVVSPTGAAALTAVIAIATRGRG